MPGFLPLVNNIIIIVVKSTLFSKRVVRPCNIVTPAKAKHVDIKENVYFVIEKTYGVLALKVQSAQR